MEPSALRARYAEASQHEGAVDALLADLSAAEPTALSLAYHAATEALLARKVPNPLQKLSHLQQSATRFRQAVRQAPHDPEVRLLRFAVQHGTPKFLGMSTDMRQDKAVLVSEADELSQREWPPHLLAELLTFVRKSGLCTSADEAVLADVAS